MSTISSVTQAPSALSTGSTSSQGTSTTGASSLGENDFLTLLSAQLQYQDPLQPMDNSAFVAQLAQFSSLQSLQNISSQLTSMQTSASSTNELVASDLVGMQVNYNATGVSLPTAGASTTFGVNVTSDATSGTATISNSSGQVIQTLQLGALSASSTNSETWNGLDSNGNPAPAGTYTVTLTAAAVNGASDTASLNQQGVVTGVSLSGSSPAVIVAGQLIPLSQIVSVSQPQSGG